MYPFTVLTNIIPIRDIPLGFNWLVSNYRLSSLGDVCAFSCHVARLTSATQLNCHPQKVAQIHRFSMRRCGKPPLPNVYLNNEILDASQTSTSRMSAKQLFRFRLRLDWVFYLWWGIMSVCESRNWGEVGRNIKFKLFLDLWFFHKPTEYREIHSDTIA